MNAHMRGEGAKEMHVGPTMLASHDKLWISLFFWSWKMWDSIHNNNEDNNNDDNNNDEWWWLKEKNNHECYTPTTHADTP